MGFATREGLLPAIVVMVLPFVILWALVRLFPPEAEQEAGGAAAADGPAPRGTAS
jgi:hypothetical protein